MGAVIAALLAEGLEPEEILAQVRGIQRHDVARLRAAGLVQGLCGRLAAAPRAAAADDRAAGGVTTFGELTLPLTVTAADLDTQRGRGLRGGRRGCPLARGALRLLRAAALVSARDRQRSGAWRMAGSAACCRSPVAARFEADLVVAVDAGPGADAAPASGRLAPPPFVRAFTDVMHVMMSANTELSVALWRATPGQPAADLRQAGDGARCDLRAGPVRAVRAGGL